MKTGIFGGTFDPPHIGHLIAAQDALEILCLDRVLFVPAGQPPHKLQANVTAAPQRLELLRAAVGDDPRFEISELELVREGPTYTVDTLRELRELYPKDELYLLLGADQVQELNTWKDPATIAALARIVMVARAGVSTLRRTDPRLFRTVEITRVDVSATEIRQRVAHGRPIRYLVPEAVERIIVEKGFYLAGVAAKC